VQLQVGLTFRCKTFAKPSCDANLGSIGDVAKVLGVSVMTDQF